MNDNDLLRGRRALVTGGGRGIGRAIAVSLAQAAAQVAVHYVADRAAAEAACRDLPGEGHICLSADLGDVAAARALPAQAAASLGGLDIVVNNAGVFTHHDLADDDWQAAWDRTLAVNLTGPAAVIAGAVPYLEGAGGGHIVNVSSRGAYRGEPDAPAYGAAKAGLNSLTQSLAVKLAPRGIHLVAVAPGWVETDMTRVHLAGPEGEAIRAQSPHGRTATADEVAAVVLLAVSGRADALTGGVIDVNLASHLR